MSLSIHANLKFTQGIKVFEDTEQHHNKMLISVKALHISLTSLGLAANLKNFLLVKQF